MQLQKPLDKMSNEELVFAWHNTKQRGEKIKKPYGGGYTFEELNAEFFRRFGTPKAISRLCYNDLTLLRGLVRLVVSPDRLKKLLDGGESPKDAFDELSIRVFEIIG